MVEKKKIFQNYGANGFTADPTSGLLVPTGSVELKDVKQLISDISKSDEETRAAFEKKIDRKLGTLYATWYSLFSNQLSQHGAAGKPRHTVPLSMLRQAFRQSLIDQVIVNCREQQIKMVSEKVITPKLQKGWRVRHVRHADPYFTPSKTDLARIKEVEWVIEHPWSEVHPDFRDVLVKMVRGELIVDRKAMPIIRDSVGKPLRWYLLPPDEIRPRFDVLYRYMKEKGIADTARGIESFYLNCGIDLSKTAYVQELDDFQISGAWKEGEIEIDITNPDDQLNMLGYGISLFEKSIEATSVLLYAMKFQKDYFLKNFPDQMLIINGEVDPAGLEYFKQQIYANAGPQGNQRFPILPTNDEDYKVQLLRLSDTAVDMQLISLIRFIVAIKCAAYRLHPSTINLAPDMGERGTAVIASAQDQADVIGALTEEGFKGLLLSVAHFINRAIIRPWYDDLILVFDVEDVPPEKDRIAIWTQKVSMGVTADEFRASEGLPPLELVTQGKYDGKTPLSPFILQAKEMDMQEEMMEQQMELEQDRVDNSGFTGGANPSPSGKATKMPKSKEKPPKPKAKPKAKAKSKVKKSLGVISYLWQREN